MQGKRVGIVLFEEVDVLDFSGPFEVFSTTRLNEERRRQEPSPFEVLLVAERPDALTTAGGMLVLPHVTFDDCPRLEILVSPGGWGTRREVQNPRLLNWLRACAPQAQSVVGVCTGAMLLGFAGLLDGLHATTHWGALEWMRESFPRVSVDRGKHFIQDGRVFTCAGISAGIDVSLKVVAFHYGEEIARATARHMEYPYPETDARRIQI